MPDPADQALRARVRQALDAIVDPCSATAGAPAGLLAMGLVRSIDIIPGAAGADVVVTLALTEPSCLMGPIFQADAIRRVSALEGVATASVGIDYDHVWTPAEMTAAYRERLARHRAAAATFSRPARHPPAAADGHDSARPPARTRKV